ncbi:MAG: FAD-dependent oxidoreductase [Rhodoglobus sp.]
MKQWFDRVTGAVTMYKLVIVVLAAIGVVAFALSLFGIGTYPPLALLASAAVAVAVTYGSSMLIATVLRVKVHLDSAIITGLLIFFIMEPTLEPLGLAGIALAGVVANLSKYLIAVRSRHVFNPAAFGVFVVALVAFTGFGFGFAIWWLGSSTYLIPVALGAFLVLYRIQRLSIGLIFIAMTTLGSVLYFLVVGETVLGALQYVFLSSPVVFFAGFMFSEPLTLAPRRWQQVIEAAVVAALFSVPFTFGPISRTPQFALLVGNLIGFAFGQRRGIRLTFLGKTQLAPTTWELSFQPARSVRFVPGQYMELAIPHRRADFRGSRRYFSISSAPTVDGPITFAITRPTKSSSFKQALLDLEPGAVVTGTGVSGDFALPSDMGEPLLLVAGGIGITPFASQLAHATERGEKRDVVVVYSTSAVGSLPYGDLLAKTGARVVLYSPERPATLPTGWEYGGEGRVTGERLAAAVPDVARRRAFVSGPPSLVNDLRRALRSQGAKRVHSDYFSGY